LQAFAKRIGKLSSFCSFFMSVFVLLQFVQFRGDAVVFTSPLNRLILGVLRGHLVLVGDGLICVVSIVGAAADNERLESAIQPRMGLSVQYRANGSCVSAFDPEILAPAPKFQPTKVVIEVIDVVLDVRPAVILKEQDVPFLHQQKVVLRIPHGGLFGGRHLFHRNVFLDLRGGGRKTDGSSFSFHRRSALLFGMLQRWCGAIHNVWNCCRNV